MIKNKIITFYLKQSRNNHIRALFIFKQIFLVSGLVCCNADVSASTVNHERQTIALDNILNNELL